jgi:hypothetical protein
VVAVSLPFLGFAGFYQWKFSMVPLDTFIDLLASQKSILSAMISVSLLLNAAALTLFFQKQIDKTAKGIFFTTCVYAIAAIAVKWFL